MENRIVLNGVTYRLSIETCIRINRVNQQIFELQTCAEIEHYEKTRRAYTC